MVRMFVIPARDEPVAVILRRGPSRWYHVIQWDMRRDQFTHGAWIKGRIFEEFCDVSPDGRLFLYFVHQGSRGGTEFTHAWTAVSRVPWLQALVLWPQGTTYGGGGRFIENRQIALRPVWHDPDYETHPNFPVQGLTVVDSTAELRCSTGEVTDADWSGRDHRGELIYTRGGQLVRRIGNSEHLVADFTDLKPDPQPAPEWAQQPL